jgi:MFS family permease
MSPATSSVSTRRWWALAAIAAAQFMVIMDTSIIGVALPKMQTDLGFAPQDLSWVFNAYVVAFGGLLLLGGRLADLLGARKVFIAGWVVLLAGSVVAGAAGDAGVELAGRAVQGAGAALIAPSALTLLMVLFAGNGKELTRASRCTVQPHRPAGPLGCSSAESSPSTRRGRGCSTSTSPSPSSSSPSRLR